MVRIRGRVQRDGHGIVGTLARGSIQLLPATILPQNRPSFSGSNGKVYFHKII